jgi:hypothetical protein
MKVTCDNCFVGFSGEMFIDIELALFKVKKVAVGFKDMYLKGGLGVELDALLWPGFLVYGVLKFLGL